jgi:hypothetical protein
MASTNSKKKALTMKTHALGGVRPRPMKMRRTLLIKLFKKMNQNSYLMNNFKSHMKSYLKILHHMSSA